MIAGCATQAPRDTASPWYAPPAGTRVVLPQPVTIPARSARVFFQDGRVTGRGVNHFAPHCELEVNAVRETAWRVPAGEFVITDVSRRTQEVVRAQPRQLAVRFGIGVGFGLFGGSDVGDVMEAWVMRLQGEGRTDVRALICGGAFDHPSRAETPSIAEMRAALGEHVLLELPEPKPP